MGREVLVSRPSARSRGFSSAKAGWVLVPLLMAASACTLLNKSPDIDIRAVQQTADPGVAPDDALYNAAVRAISGRDYALALDYLQAARQKWPFDIRVLNGFGVVYDKLGRFDLSARYYGEAAKLDPKSPIVAANLAYSAVLQGRSDASSASSDIVTANRAASPPGEPVPSASQIAITNPEPASLSQIGSPVHPAMAEPGAQTRLAFPPYSSRLGNPEGSTRPAMITSVELPEQASRPGNEKWMPKIPVPRAKPARRRFLTGAPLVIVNASGHRGTSEPVRLNLASRGWTAPRWAMQDGGPQAATTIRYMPSNTVVAHALARTLPFPSVLVKCRIECRGVRLVLGRDVLQRTPIKSVAGQIKKG